MNFISNYFFSVNALIYMVLLSWPFIYWSKTANNSTTNYFDCYFQTEENNVVRLVCYSPNKLHVLHLQRASEKSPIKLQKQRNTNNRFTSDKEEYTIVKAVKIMPARLCLQWIMYCVDKLLTVWEALEVNVYPMLDLKVKIITSRPWYRITKHNIK